MRVSSASLRKGSNSKASYAQNTSNRKVPRIIDVAGKPKAKVDVKMKVP